MDTLERAPARLHLPADVAAQERAKYAQIWSIPEYHDHSPGLESVDRFMNVLAPPAGASVIDLGAGACVAGMRFLAHGLDPWFLDLTDTAVPPAVDRRRLILAPLWADWAKGRRWDYGFCCDVLEHIPTEYAMLVVERILAACDVAWLQVSLVPDSFGQRIGEPLHLTVQPFAWWLCRIAGLGEIVDARDLCGMGLYVVRR